MGRNPANAGEPSGRDDASRTEVRCAAVAEPGGEQRWHQDPPEFQPSQAAESVDERVEDPDDDGYQPL